MWVFKQGVVLLLKQKGATVHPQRMECMMKHNPIYPAVLVAISCFAPLSASAKPTSLSDQTLILTKNGSNRLSKIGEIQAENSGATDLAVAPFRFRLLTGTTKIRTHHITLSWGSGALTLNTVRAKSPRRPDAMAVLNFNRFAVWNTDAGVVQDLDSANSLSLGLSYAQERRRPSFSVAGHNSYKTNNSAITLGWKREDSFALNASLFSTKPNRSRSLNERIVELAGGAPITARGMALTATFGSTHDPAALSFGIDLRRQQLGLNDAKLIGIASARKDTRVGLFLARSF